MLWGVGEGGCQVMIIPFWLKRGAIRCTLNSVKMEIRWIINSTNHNLTNFHSTELFILNFFCKKHKRQISLPWIFSIWKWNHKRGITLFEVFKIFQVSPHLRNSFYLMKKISWKFWSTCGLSILCVNSETVWLVVVSLA